MKKLLLTTLLAASASAFAVIPGPIGRVIYTPLDSIRIDTDGLVIAYFATPILYADLFTPGCRDSSMDHAMAIDANTDAGKAILSVLLEAKASGFTVTAFGTGRCMTVDGSRVEVLQFARVL